jgi:hypothetical protein
MAIPSYLLAFLVAFSVALLGILIVRLTQKKSQRQSQQRKELIERVKTLPMCGLFKQMGVSFGKFFYSMPLTEVDQTIRLCETCSSARQCQAHQSARDINSKEFEFCPLKGMFLSKS